jgi:hypothetical protein
MVGITGVLREGKVDDSVFGGIFIIKEGDTLTVIGDIKTCSKHAA